MSYQCSIAYFCNLQLLCMTNRKDFHCHMRYSWSKKCMFASHMKILRIINNNNAYSYEYILYQSYISSFAYKYV